MTKPSSSQKRHRVLPVLAMLFALAATLRLASGISAAMAQDPAPSDHQAESHAAPAGMMAEPAMEPVHMSAQSRDGDGEHVSAEFLIDLRRREIALQEREAAIRQQEALVSAGQERLQAQLDALLYAEQELTATLALADRAAEEDIGRLVNVFQAMGSEEAAAVFTEMAPEFAAGFIGRLPPENAAAILAGLEPRQAYGLSAILAGRNALVPRD